MWGAQLAGDVHTWESGRGAAIEILLQRVCAVAQSFGPRPWGEA